MALQVWLPLNGNLNNQGSSNLTFSINNSSNTIIDNSGKIGKCYSNNSFSAGGLLSNTTINLGTNQSMFCWFKFTNLTSSSSLGGAMITQHRYPKNTGMGLTIKYVSSTTGYLSINTGNGSSRTYNTYCGTTLLQANTWYHGGYTYDGTTIKLYLNGVCEKEVSYSGMSTPADYIAVYCWAFNGNSGTGIEQNYRLNGSLNDVRIYDHALSPKEIEVLSRGLVCHYPLTGGGRGGANLAKGTNTASIDTNQFRFSEAVGGSTPTIEYDGGIPCAKITRNSTAHSSWAYLHYDNWHRNAIKPDTWYTLSMDIKGSGNGNVGVNGFLQRNATNSITDTIEIIQNNFTTEWSHLVYYIHTISDFTGKGTRQVIYMSCGFLNGVDRWIMMKNFHLEEGRGDSNWIPHYSDAAYTIMGYDSTTEYDVSGYGYNGTKIGSPTYSSDTPRYSISTSFNGVDDCIQVPLNTFFSNAGSFTINLWFKKHELGSKYYETVFGGISGFEIDTRNNTSTTLSYYVTGNNRGLTVQSPLSLDTWYMLTMVCDGTNELYYLNGEYKKQIKKKNMPTGNYFIGAWRDNVSQNFKGLISDFRVYSTALTATQVAELYNTAISVSNNGALLGYELVEV